jgi:hypothetical protein
MPSEFVKWLISTVIEALVVLFVGFEVVVGEIRQRRAAMTGQPLPARIISMRLGLFIILVIGLIWATGIIGYRIMSDGSHPSPTAFNPDPSEAVRQERDQLRQQLTDAQVRIRGLESQMATAPNVQQQSSPAPNRQGPIIWELLLQGGDSSSIAGISFIGASVSSVEIKDAYVMSDLTGEKQQLMIELFATTNLKALTSKLLQSPDQFGWVVDFQRNRFQASLSDKHKERYNAFLGPVIDRNFRGGAVSAFAQMTGHLFEDITRNTTRIPEMEALDIPVKLIWGENDSYLNVGVAEDLRSHLSDASLHRIPAGHWVQIDEPELVASAMLS